MVRSVLLALLIAHVCMAQPVRAPHAQALIEDLMAKHKEMQTIGLHLTPPGWTDNLNIACSKPGKVGKLSADLDTAVIRTGQPSSRRTEKGAFDMGLPLTDRQGRAVGMVVIVIRETFTRDADAAMKQAALIRDELRGQIASTAELLKGALLVKSSAAMVIQTPLPGIAGGFGHFALDDTHDRLFLAAEDNHSIEVLNAAGEHLKSAPLVKTPHTLAYDAKRNVLLVADGGDNSCTVLDAGDLHVVKRIPLAEGVDAGVFDIAQRVFYIGTRGSISMISADTLGETGRIPVDSQDLAGMAIDRATGRVFVNLRDKGKVAVISIGNRKVQATWDVPGVRGNSAMAFGASLRHLFVAGRNPGKLAVLDSQTGKLLQTLDVVEGADDLWFDPERRRVYVTGSGGLSIFAADKAGRYRLDSQFGTMRGKTSLYLAATRLLYTVHGASAEDGAGMQVYHLRDLQL